MMGETNLIPVVNYEDFGVEKTKAKEIEAAFTPMVEAMVALQPQYEKLKIAFDGTPPGEETVELAAELLKKYVKVRTGTAKAHKEQKAPFLQAGKFIDGLKNAQKEASDHYEGELKAIVSYLEDREKERLQALQMERVEAIRPYLPEASNHPDYAGMPDFIWDNYLKAAKEAFDNPQLSQNEKMAIMVKTIKYMISVWDEVLSTAWRDKPDHVQQMFIEAEKII